MASDSKHTGACFCGAVEVTVTGDSVGMGYCHCESCRAWSAAPVNAFTLWPSDMVRITRGADKVGRFQKTERSIRQWCTICGGHIMTEHPLWKLTDVYSAIIPGVAFKPGIHVNYEDMVLRMRDGLPKQKDFPKELAGSGQIIAE